MQVEAIIDDHEVEEIDGVLWVSVDYWLATRNLGVGEDGEWNWIKIKSNRNANLGVGGEYNSKNLGMEGVRESEIQGEKSDDALKHCWTF